MEHTQNELCKREFSNINDRLAKLEDKTDDIAVMREQIKQLTTLVEKLVVKIDLILDKPSKNWDTAILAIITGVIGAVIAYFVK